VIAAGVNAAHSQRICPLVFPILRDLRKYYTPCKSINQIANIEPNRIDPVAKKYFNDIAASKVLLKNQAGPIPKQAV
jgi:hypothetical protein